MKKLFIVLALVLFAAVTTVHAFYGAADPRTTDGAAYVTVSVYNNSGSDLDEGDVVVWQVGSATGDNDLYVTTTTTADTGLVAGVVMKDGIATASVGDIIVYGLAQCDIESTPLGQVANGALLCTAGTVGDGEPCIVSDNSQAYAIANAAIAAGAQGSCFVLKNK